MSVDHFTQNGNIKNIAHIDAEVYVENDTNDNQPSQTSSENAQSKTTSKNLPDDLELEITIKDAKSDETKENPDAINTNDADVGKDEKSGYQLFRYPKEKSPWRQVMWFVVWPIHLLFVLTIPNCEQKRFKNLFPLTFLMCIIWIGSLSYVVAWMITIVGKGPVNIC